MQPKTLLIIISLTFTTLATSQNLTSDTTKLANISHLQLDSATIINQNITSPLNFDEFLDALSLCDALKIPRLYARIPFIYMGDTTLNARAGSWGLTVPVAKQYGLMVNEHYDERHLIAESTYAALSHISRLHSVYRNIVLTFLAYTHSPAIVNNHMEMHDIDSIHILQFYDDTNFDTTLIDRFIVYSNIDIKTIYDITSLRKNEDLKVITFPTPIYTDIFLKNTNLTLSQFKNHNPCLRLKGDKLLPQYNILIPDSILLNKDTIYSICKQRDDSILRANTIPLPDTTAIEKKEEPAPKKKIVPYYKVINYTIRPNDTLAKIAAKFKVSVNDIIRWNNLRSNRINPGRILKIRSTKATIYRVKPNDTLSAIAEKFNVSVSTLMKWNNLESPDKLDIDQVIKIYK